MNSAGILIALGSLLAVTEGTCLGEDCDHGSCVHG